MTEKLLNDGHETIVFDNLVKGPGPPWIRERKFVHADLMDSDVLHRALKDNSVEAVFTWQRIHSSANQSNSPRNTH